MRLTAILLGLTSFWALTAGAQWNTSGNDISNSNSVNVGIGTSSPDTKLHVNGLTTLNGASSPTNLLNETRRIDNIISLTRKPVI